MTKRHGAPGMIRTCDLLVRRHVASPKDLASSAGRLANKFKQKRPRRVRMKLVITSISICTGTGAAPRRVDTVSCAHKFMAEINPAKSRERKNRRDTNTPFT